MCGVAFSIPHEDLMAHLRQINERLRARDVKIKVSEHPRNIPVSYREEVPECIQELKYWNHRPKLFWVYSLFKGDHPAVDVAYRDYTDLFFKLGKPRVLLHNGVLAAMTDDALFLLSMNDGILYENAEWLKDLPVHQELLH